MPAVPTYPGVYLQEIPSGVRTLTGVGASITAFVGAAQRGPVNIPITIFSFAEFEGAFGGLSIDSTMSYAVYHYFLNGGSQAVIVRVVGTGAAIGTLTIGGMALAAASEGAWSKKLSAQISHDGIDTVADTKTFHLIVREHELADTTSSVVRQESFYNVSVDTLSTRYIKNVLTSESSLIRATSTPGTLTVDVPMTLFGTNGADASIAESNILGQNLNGAKGGFNALDNVDQFNLLVIPPTSRTTNISKSTWDAARAYCTRRRAMLIVDPPLSWNSYDDVTDAAVSAVVTRHRDAALYFPHILAADPLLRNQPMQFMPGGAVAGVIARTAAERGVWKSPAGIDARLAGVGGLSVMVTDSEQGMINPLGVNVLRVLPGAGSLIWGSRTLDGADRLLSEWKYLAVRRTALYIEESLYRGTQWVVFEPNDESLWAQIRLNVGTFMHQLFRQGAFQGAKPSEAYYVKCDRETTTQDDINMGVVNIMVGFAPLKPAEFVVIKLQQIAGQS